MLRDRDPRIKMSNQDDHDEGRFTMIQTKNTNSLKKKMRTKMAKTRITRFLQINIALHCKSEIQPFN